MRRQVVKIDEDRCNGCGACVRACHEGALAMEGGKAKLVRDDLCDGMGDCLPKCPQNAISFDMQEASDLPMASARPVFGGAQWPIQIRLVPVNAPFLRNADVLVAADCTAFADPASFKEESEGKILLIGCPKLDPDQTSKLAEMFSRNDVKSITVMRMDVPCCGGLDRSVRSAAAECGKGAEYRCRVISRNA
ncbi:MAG: 4Fe-4S binding protein [Candidatus Methanoplasma sp.]|jgi:NAD-dependent dihydropyrimidine dehydrogenase PreA subunit|nr:4Fe-4S binding protein [Candidatus Methanoplasma sp.]